MTIEGCFNASTGAITFAGYACDDGDYTGCFVASGVHAGQIAVTVSEVNCDDTYYGCFDPATGHFEVEIPDDCCETPPVYSDYDCEYCTAGETPLQVDVQVSNLSVCACVLCESVNPDASIAVSLSNVEDTWRIDQYIPNYCSWFKIFSGSFGTYRIYGVGDTGCSGEYTEYALDRLYVGVNRVSAVQWEAYINVQHWPGHPGVNGPHLYTGSGSDCVTFSGTATQTCREQPASTCLGALAISSVKYTVTEV